MSSGPSFDDGSIKTGSNPVIPTRERSAGIGLNIDDPISNNRSTLSSTSLSSTNDGRNGTISMSHSSGANVSGNVIISNVSSTNNVETKSAPFVADGGDVKRAAKSTTTTAAAVVDTISTRPTISDDSSNTDDSNVIDGTIHEPTEGKAAISDNGVTTLSETKVSIIINDLPYQYDVAKGRLLKPFVISVRGAFHLIMKQKGRKNNIEKPFIQKLLSEYLDAKCPALFNDGHDGAPMVLYDRIMAFPGRNNSSWSFHLNGIDPKYALCVIRAINAVKDTNKWRISEYGTKPSPTIGVFIHRSIGIKDEMLEQLVKRIHRAGILSFKVHDRIRDGKKVDCHAFVGDRQLRYGVDARIAAGELNKLRTQGVLLPGCTIYQCIAPEVILCHRCQQPGHLMSSCKGELSCRICGTAGHADKICPNKLDVEKITCRICVDRGVTTKYEHSTLNCHRTQHYKLLTIIKNNNGIKSNKSTRQVAMPTSATLAATPSPPLPKSSAEGQLRQSYAAAAAVQIGNNNRRNSSSGIRTNDNNNNQKQDAQQQPTRDRQQQVIDDITARLTKFEKQMDDMQEKLDSIVSSHQKLIEELVKSMAKDSSDVAAVVIPKAGATLTGSQASLSIRTSNIPKPTAVKKSTPAATIIPNTGATRSGATYALQPTPISPPATSVANSQLRGFFNSPPKPRHPN